MVKVMLVDSKNYDREKASVSEVVISLDNGHARIIKDRTGRAFNLFFERIDNINAVLEAIYPGYKLEDCRA